MKLIFDAPNKVQSRWKDKLNEAAKICLANEGIMTDHVEISLSFVSEVEIQEMNRIHRNVDAVTDVLSFPMFEAGELAKAAERAAQKQKEPESVEPYLLLGDVVICEAQARRQAKEYGHSYDREVVYLFVHSMLHLLGYDHMEEEDKAVMRAQEEIIMRELNLTRENSMASALEEYADETERSICIADEKEECRVFEKLLAAGRDKAEIYKELIARAQSVLPLAYAPFSKFRVGAALLTKDDFVCTGVNIENSSFGATICAERTAFTKALSYGVKEFKAIAVVSSSGSAWPCGICRQFMKEFCSDDFEIISLNENGAVSVYTMEEILPEGFKL